MHLSRGKPEKQTCHGTTFDCKMNFVEFSKSECNICIMHISNTITYLFNQNHSHITSLHTCTQLRDYMCNSVTLHGTLQMADYSFYASKPFTMYLWCDVVYGDQRAGSSDTYCGKVSAVPGRRNRFCRLSDRWTNIYCVVPKKRADAISEVLRAWIITCFTASA